MNTTHNKIMVFCRLVVFITLCSIIIYISNNKSEKQVPQKTNKTQQQLEDEKKEDMLHLLIIVS